MKKKIAILGSTGSIGKSTLDVIRKDKKNFEIVFLSANNNYKKLIQQAKEFNVKNVLIKNKIYYERTKRGLKNSKTKVYSGDISITNIISKKLDYTMAAIVGVAGLQPTIDAIKISKTVALANKESIICGWEILSRLIKKYKTKILPVDSEHFSIMELTKDVRDDEVEEIIITASGGPFLNTPKNKVNQSQEITKTKPVVSKSSTSFMERSQQDLQSFQAAAEHISQAVEALDNKKFNQAIEQFQKAIQQNQESAEAHFYLGLSHFMLEQYEEAVISYKTAIACEPGDSMMYLHLGVVCQILNRLEEAAEAYKHTIALNPDDPEGYSRLGAVLSDLGQRDEARIAFKKALAVKLNATDS